MRLPALDAYKLFLALKSHFTQQSYDFHKYNGKVNASRESFLARRDQYQFQKLSRVCEDDEMVDFIIATLSELPDIWVGDLLKEDAMNRYRAFVKVKQSLTHTISNDLDKLLKEVENPKDIFAVRPDGYPVIVDALISGDVSAQTVAILNDFIPFIKKFDEKVDDDFFWPKLSFRLKKLRPFLSYDRQKILAVLSEKLKDGA